MRLSFSGAAIRAALPLLLLAAACGGTSGSAARSSTASTPAPAPAPAAARPASYANGEAVVEAMWKQWEHKWYPTITFVQKTSRLDRSGNWNVQTWYEAGKFPGRLRIDFEPLRAGNGVLYARDSIFTIQNGRPLPGRKGLNPLALLGFDVYHQSPIRTAAELRREGFDMKLAHLDTFQGRPVIVVGARSGDLHRKQFWVDAERLYFVRLLEPTAQDTTKVQDIRFVNYQKIGDSYVAPRVEIYDPTGKLVFFEEYSDINTDVPLDDALFDPRQWKTAKHWVK